MVARHCSSGSTSFAWNSLRATTDRHPIRMSVFCMLGCVVAVLWLRWCSGRRSALAGRAAWCARGRTARPRAVRAASFARRVDSLSGQAPPPPTGTAAWPRCRPAMRPVTHVKPSTPLLACALYPVKPTTPLQARYTCFWCYFIEQRRRGFLTGVLIFQHWC